MELETSNKAAGQTHPSPSRVGDQLVEHRLRVVLYVEDECHVSCRKSKVAVVIERKNNIFCH